MIDLYSSSSNLGDNLGLTALASLTPCRVHMYDDIGCRSVSPIFHGVCEVVHDNGSPTTGGPKSNDPTHLDMPTTRRHLVAAGIYDQAALPVMKLTEDEIAKAREFLKPFPNPCIIKCSPQVTDARTPPIELLTQIVQQNPGVSFLNFGLSKNHAKYNFSNLTVPGLSTFFDLPIREQAAIYHLVGRYIGPDTGDYHMMLSVGGTCDVLVPPQSQGYRYQFFHYGPECWAGLPVRVKYHEWMRPLDKFITGLANLVKVSVDEGYGYDMLSIMAVKRVKVQSRDSDLNFDRLSRELERQVGMEMHGRVLDSHEYKQLLAVNTTIFDHIDEIKLPGRVPLPADGIKTDELNHQRYQLKKAIQSRFFPAAKLSEQKFGYKDT